MKIFSDYKKYESDVASITEDNYAAFCKEGKYWSLDIGNTGNENGTFADVFETDASLINNMINSVESLRLPKNEGIALNKIFKVISS